MCTVEFENGPDDAVFDDENPQDSAEMDESDNISSELESLDTPLKLIDKIYNLCGNNYDTRDT